MTRVYDQFTPHRIDHTLGTTCPVFQDVSLAFGEAVAYRSREAHLEKEIGVAKQRGDRIRQLRLELYLFEVQDVLRRHVTQAA